MVKMYDGNLLKTYFEVQGNGKTITFAPVNYQ